MKILITGANGFIGKNLVSELRNEGHTDLLLVSRQTTNDELKRYATEADFVFHLAGINRPKQEEEFNEGNVEFTEKLLKYLTLSKKKAPIMVASSVQAILDNPYGISKQKSERIVREYGEKYNVKTLIYRFPNVFGKWSKANYNSAVATFCYNISRDLPIQVNNRETLLELAYIDDVIRELVHCLTNSESSANGFCFIPTTYKQTLGWIVDTISTFKDSRESLKLPNLGDDFTKKLYSTYLSFLPQDDFAYSLKMNIDNRGSFTEFLRTTNAGQVSINISKPHIVKGNHWHHTKNEKFLVVSGKGVIRFRKLDEENIIEYFVSGEKLEVVDIPVGYTHNIENLGEEEMVTVMWSNEPFNPDEPDTYFLEV